MQIPQERLNEIALRRLRRLGIEASPGGSGVLEGVVAFARLAEPLAQRLITQAAFRVVGHDSLQFLVPPLGELGPIQIHDLNERLELENRLTEGLRKRLAVARAAADEMERLRLDARLDPSRLVALCDVTASGRRFILEGDGAGFRIARLVVGDSVRDVGGPAAALDLRAFTSLVDLELELSVRQAQLEVVTSAPPPARAAAPKAAPLSRVQPEGGLPVAALAARFGHDARLASFELVEDFSDGKETWRVTSRWTGGATFHTVVTRPSSPGQPLFSDAVDPGRIAGSLELLAAVLGRSVQSAPEANEQEPEPTDSTQILPRVGEVWIMSVLIEREDPEEIRYVLTDIDGRPYGAQRILKRDDFLAVFAEDRGAYRLRIRIEEMRGQQVVYRQLNAAGQLAPEARSVPFGTFATTFFPEAMAY